MLLIGLKARKKRKHRKGKKSVLCNLKVSNREECQVGNSKEINDNKRFCDIAVVGSLCSIETVDNNILLDRLSQRFGIVGHTLEWFACYLSDCQQTVHINGCQSSQKSL